MILCKSTEALSFHGCKHDYKGVCLLYSCYIFILWLLVAHNEYIISLCIIVSNIWPERTVQIKNRLFQGMFFQRFSETSLDTESPAIRNMDARFSGGGLSPSSPFNLLLFDGEVLFSRGSRADSLPSVPILSTPFSLPTGLRRTTNT